LPGLKMLARPVERPPAPRPRGEEEIQRNEDGDGDGGDGQDDIHHATLLAEALCGKGGSRMEDRGSTRHVPRPCLVDPPSSILSPRPCFVVRRPSTLVPCTSHRVPALTATLKGARRGGGANPARRRPEWPAPSRPRPPTAAPRAGRRAARTSRGRRGPWPAPR